MSNYPYVSICTATFNRRHFIPLLIRCINSQLYPLERIEWVVMDDGSDPIDDVLVGVLVNRIKYFYFDKKMSLGRKRNLMHQKCSGDIIIYMDDDDYYPPSRVSHAVETLVANPHNLIAGCSEMHMYHKNIPNAIYKCGPYGRYHSTAATFAFKRELLETSKYDDGENFTEEPHFLKNYTIPLVQLDTLKTILVMGHEQNTLDKECLIKKQREHGITLTPLSIEFFIKDKDLMNEYIMVHDKLKDYGFGEVGNKPDVVQGLKNRNNEIYIRTLIEKNEEFKKKIKSCEKLMEEQTLVIHQQSSEIRRLKK